MSRREIYHEHKESDTMVVFIHGILESPKQFRYLAVLAYRQGYSVTVLCLPGHEASADDFANSSVKSWVSKTNRVISEIERRYKKIILVGHSMGALLCFGYYLHKPKHILAIVTINMPLFVRIKYRVLKGAAKIALGRIKEQERYVMAEYHAIGVGKGHLGAYIKWIPRYLELFALIRYIRKRLKQINPPVLVIQATKDEFVRMKSIDLLNKQLPNIQTVILDDSGHFCYHHSDLKMIEYKFIRFIQTIAPKNGRSFEKTIEHV